MTTSRPGRYSASTPESSGNEPHRNAARLERLEEVALSGAKRAGKKAGKLAVRAAAASSKSVAKAAGRSGKSLARAAGRSGTSAAKAAGRLGTSAVRSAGSASARAGRGLSGRTGNGLRRIEDALSHGRVAMVERERELRAEAEGRLLTPELEARLRAQLIEKALPDDLRAELLLRAIPEHIQDAILDMSMTTQLEAQLRRELLSSRPPLRSGLASTSKSRRLVSGLAERSDAGNSLPAQAVTEKSTRRRSMPHQ